MGGELSPWRLGSEIAEKKKPVQYYSFNMHVFGKLFRIHVNNGGSIILHHAKTSVMVNLGGLSAGSKFNGSFDVKNA